ncbi:SPW repeat domain-containing protein [Cryptosporangium japonicum]
MTWSPTRPARAGRVSTDATVGMLVVLAGLWMFLAPRFLAYESFTAVSGAERWAFPGTWSDKTAGLLIAAAMITRLVLPGLAQWCMAAVAAVGAWLVAAPFVLSYGSVSGTWPAIWNDVIGGVVLLLLAAAGALTARE